MIMKLNVEDPNALNFEIFLNGKLQKLCFEADEEKGYIKNYKSDKNGLIICDEQMNPIIKILHGNVEIKKSKWI